jgi:predicted RNase H-like HicB family nuclease
MTQGETIAELEENIKEAFYLMNWEDIPEIN